MLGTRGLRCVYCRLTRGRQYDALAALLFIFLSLAEADVTKAIMQECFQTSYTIKVI